MNIVCFKRIFFDLNIYAGSGLIRISVGDVEWNQFSLVASTKKI